MDITPIVEQFIADVCAGKSNSTPGAYRSKLHRLVHWMDNRHHTLAELTTTDITSFIHSLQNRKEKRSGSRTIKGALSPFTIHTALRTTKHFLHWSYQHGLTQSDLSLFKLTTPPHPDPKAIDAANVTALILAASRLGDGWEQARNLAILYMLRDTGGRISAILSADMDNLDLATGRLDTVEKGATPHTLYLNPPACLALSEWLRVRPILHPKCHKLIISCRGYALTRSGWYSILNRLIDAADLRGKGRCNAHAFRHAFARDSLAAGADLTRVSQQMGHSTVRVTADYYARWSDKELQEAHARFSPGAKLFIIRPTDTKQK